MEEEIESGRRRKKIQKEHIHKTCKMKDEEKDERRVIRIPTQSPIVNIPKIFGILYKFRRIAYSSSSFLARSLPSSDLPFIFVSHPPLSFVACASCISRAFDASGLLFLPLPVPSSSFVIFLLSYLPFSEWALIWYSYL